MFLRHKQLQEHLASLYLSHHEFTTSPLMDFMSQKCDKSLSQVLGEHNLLKTVQFTCGQSSKIFKEILSKAAENLVIDQDANGNVDIYLEAALLQETESPKPVSAFQEYLIKCDVTQSEQGFASKYFDEADIESTSSDDDIQEGNETENKILSPKIQRDLGEFEMYQKCLTDSVDLIDNDSAIKLLEKLYKLSLKEFENGYLLSKIQEKPKKLFGKLLRKLSPTKPTKPKPDRDNILSLDQLQMALLRKFRCKNVTNLKVRNDGTAYVDLPVLCEVFPGVTKLDIACAHYVSYRCGQAVEDKEQNTVTDVSLYNGIGDSSLSEEQTKWLLNQQSLCNLSLIGTDITATMVKLSAEPTWKYINQLTIIFGKDLNSDDLQAVCRILQCCTQSVKELQLVLNTTDGVDVTPLCTILAAMENLDKMFFATDTSEVTEQVVVGCIPHMKTLKHFSMHVNHIKQREDTITTALCKCSNLQKLTVWDLDGDFKPTGYAFPPSCQQRLKQHGVTVQMKIPKKPNTLDDLLEVSKSL